MNYIGVDVGKKGGFAIISEDTVTVCPWDDEKFAAAMGVVSGDSCVACIEQVHAMPKQGTVSTFNFGRSAGYIEGVMTAHRIPYQLVPPQKWKKEFSLGHDKAQSIEVCRKLFPSVNLLPSEKCKKQSDGMAEALLLALYARRKFGW